MSGTRKPTATKARLGRGLSSLITNSAVLNQQANQYEGSSAKQGDGKMPIPVPNSTATEIPVGNIGPNPYQPRRTMNDEQLAELTNSIAAEGILQPLIVAPSSDPHADQPYVLIAGQRRLRAAERAGLKTVPCVLRSPNDKQMLQWALIENIQRSDLNPIERASAYREFMDRFKLTQVEAAQHLSQPRTTVANYLRTLDLPDSVQGLLRDGLISFGHAKVLASLAGRAELQINLAKRSAGDGLSVRRLEAIVSNHPDGQTDNSSDEPKRKPAVKAAYIRDLEEQLSSTVGTRVRIMPSRAKNSGRIVIDYYSLDDFDRISGNLGLAVNS